MCQPIESCQDIISGWLLNSQKSRAVSKSLPGWSISLSPIFKWFITKYTNCVFPRFWIQTCPCIHFTCVSNSVMTLTLVGRRQLMRWRINVLTIHLSISNIFKNWVKLQYLKWICPNILVYKDLLQTYLLVSVASISTLRYYDFKIFPFKRSWNYQKYLETHDFLRHFVRWNFTIATWIFNIMPL